MWTNRRKGVLLWLVLAGLLGLVPACGPRVATEEPAPGHCWTMLGDGKRLGRIKSPGELTEAAKRGETVPAASDSIRARLPGSGGHPVPSRPADGRLDRHTHPLGAVLAGRPGLHPHWRDPSRRGGRVGRLPQVLPGRDDWPGGEFPRPSEPQAHAAEVLASRPKGSTSARGNDRPAELADYVPLASRSEPAHRRLPAGRSGRSRAACSTRSCSRPTPGAAFDGVPRQRPGLEDAPTLRLEARPDGRLVRRGLGPRAFLHLADRPECEEIRPADRNTGAIRDSGTSPSGRRPLHRVRRPNSTTPIILRHRVLAISRLGAKPTTYTYAVGNGSPEGWGPQALRADGPGEALRLRVPLPGRCPVRPRAATGRATPRGPEAPARRCLLLLAGSPWSTEGASGPTGTTFSSGRPASSRRSPSCPPLATTNISIKGR